MVQQVYLIIKLHFYLFEVNLHKLINYKVLTNRRSLLEEKQMSKNFLNIDHIKPNVLDIGTLNTRAGIGGEDTPNVIIQSLLSISKEFNDKCYIGEEAVLKREISNLKYPMKHGEVENFDDYSKLVSYLYNHELKVKPNEEATLLIEKLNNPPKKREKLTEIYFEEFEVYGYSVQNQCKMSHMSSGRNTTIVLHIGEGETSIYTINNTMNFIKSNKSLKFGGGQVTEYLTHLLRDQGYYFHSNYHKEIIREMKENISETAIDFDQLEPKEKTYKLPDGTEIKLGMERYQCMELLFNPKIFGYNLPGIHQILFDSISNCDSDSRTNFYGNILLSGGCTKSLGFKERLEKELINIISDNVKVRTVDPQDKNISAWIGGSIVSSLSSYIGFWVSKEEYEEAGASIIHRKCPY